MSYNITYDNVLDLTPFITPGQDNSSVLQEVIDTAPRGVTFHLPPGKIQASLNFTSPARLALDPKNTGIRLKGSGQNVTTLWNDTSVPVIQRNLPNIVNGVSVFPTGQNSIFISDLTIQNVNGIGVECEALIESSIERCTFNALQGLVIGRHYGTNVDIAIRDCQFQGAATSAIGCALQATANLYNVSAFNCATGFALAGSIGIFGLHAEVNGIAIDAGMSPGSIPWPTDISIYKATLESNLSGLTVEKTVTNATLTDVWATGDLVHIGGAAVGTVPANGISVLPGAGNITMLNCVSDGSFSDAAIILSGSGAVVLINTQAVNSPKSLPAGTVAHNWRISTPLALILPLLTRQS